MSGSVYHSTMVDLKEIKDIYGLSVTNVNMELEKFSEATKAGCFDLYCPASKEEDFFVADFPEKLTSLEVISIEMEIFGDTITDEFSSRLLDDYDEEMETDEKECRLEEGEDKTTMEEIAEEHRENSVQSEYVLSLIRGWAQGDVQFIYGENGFEPTDDLVEGWLSAGVPIEDIIGLIDSYFDPDIDLEYIYKQSEEVTNRVLQYFYKFYKSVLYARETEKLYK